jgi:hypothetical protein
LWKEDDAFIGRGWLLGKLKTLISGCLYLGLSASGPVEDHRASPAKWRAFIVWSRMGAVNIGDGGGCWGSAGGQTGK